MSTGEPSTFLYFFSFTEVSVPPLRWRTSGRTGRSHGRWSARCEAGGAESGVGDDWPGGRGSAPAAVARLRGGRRCGSAPACVSTAAPWRRRRGCVLVGCGLRWRPGRGQAGFGGEEQRRDQHSRDDDHHRENDGQQCFPVHNSFFSGNRVVPARVKGMAPEHPPGGEVRSLEEAMFHDRFLGVLGAGGNVAARGRKQRGDELLVDR